MTLEDWIRNKEADVELWADLFECDEAKKEELIQEFRLHSIIIHLLTNDFYIYGPYEYIWEEGFIFARRNLIFTFGYFAPRTDSDITLWSNRFLQSIRKYGVRARHITYKQFEVNAIPLWKSAPWFGKQPLPKFFITSSERQISKKKLETDTINLFIEIHNRKLSTTLTLLKIGEKPDAIIDIGNGTHLGIEITHLYGTEREATLIRSNMSVFSSGILSIYETATKLKEEIEKKSKKSYPPPVSLLICSPSPAFTMEKLQAEIIRQNITIPQNNFQDIWLLAFSEVKGWDLLKLQ